MSGRSKSAEGLADREIVVTRLIDAPRKLVFEAFKDPLHISQWWGPNGFTTTTYEMDFRVDGAWRRTMHGPDGTDYLNYSIYTDIRDGELIAYDHFNGEGGALHFHAVIRFELGGITMTATARKPAIDPFVISRVFDAPRELVFKAFTEPERMKHWWGPKGFTVIAQTMDLRPGGMYHYGLKAPDGNTMWGRFVYREIAAPERIVFVNSFSDEKGGLTRHPMSPSWPLEMLSTFLFEDLGIERTKLTIVWAPINETDEERETFEKGRPSMTGGWTGTFEQLEGYLAEFKGQAAKA